MRTSKKPTKKINKKKVSKVNAISAWLAVGKRSVIVPVVVFAFVFAGIGAYFITQSQAATITPVSNSSDCRILGRVWQDGKCTNKCISTSNGNYLVTSGAYNYCKGNISFISQTKCTNKHRVWSYLVNGCARRNDQQTTMDAYQCQYDYRRYVVASTVDYCDTPGINKSYPTSK